MNTLTLLLVWTYIHGFYFGVQSLEWINTFGVLAHGSVIS
jgi:hypothetical protein